MLECNGKVRLGMLNVDTMSEVAGQLKIRELPTILAFDNGNPNDGGACLGGQPISSP